MHRRWKADVVMIGSHGRNPLERFFLGSVSHKVAAEARCSVRIVRARGTHSPEGTRIVVGIDGSSDGRRALDEVLARTWGSRTEIHLATVADAFIAVDDQIADFAHGVAEPDAEPAGVAPGACDVLGAVCDGSSGAGPGAGAGGMPPGVLTSYCASAL